MNGRVNAKSHPIASPDASCKPHNLHFRCEELLTWWEPKDDLEVVMGFNWRTLQQLKDAVTIFLAARIHAMACRTSEMLHERKFDDVKNMMASNPNTAIDVLDYLSTTSKPEILIRVAENPSCSENTLRRLASSLHTEVRVACAENSKTPEDVLECLARDENPDVRFRIAENVSAPFSILAKLAEDDNPYVSSRAITTLERLAAYHEQAVQHGIPSCDAAREFLQEIRGIYSLGFNNDRRMVSTS